MLALAVSQGCIYNEVMSVVFNEVIHRVFHYIEKINKREKLPASDYQLFRNFSHLPLTRTDAIHK